MKKTKIASLLAAFIIIPSVASAQITARVEFPYKEYKNVHTFPMGENGALLLMFEKKTQDGKRWLKLRHYDTNLELNAIDSVEVDKDMEVFGNKIDEGTCYTMLRDGGDFEIVAYNTTRIIASQCIRRSLTHPQLKVLIFSILRKKFLLIS